MIELVVTSFTRHSICIRVSRTMEDSEKTANYLWECCLPCKAGFWQHLLLHLLCWSHSSATQFVDLRCTGPVLKHIKTHPGNTLALYRSIEKSSKLKKGHFRSKQWFNYYEWIRVDAWDPPIRDLSIPTSKALTRFSRNMRTSRKLILPILQDPSTRMTISATAGVVHTNWSTGLWETEKERVNFVALIQSHMAIDPKTLSSEETNKLNSLQSVNAGTVLLNHFVIAQGIIIGQGRTCLIYEHSGNNQPKQNYFTHSILTAIVRTALGSTPVRDNWWHLELEQIMRVFMSLWVWR